MRPLSFLFLLVLFAQCQSQKHTSERPNVIILFTDDQRFNTIHALGNEDIHTPNLDRLVNMGMTYTRAHIPGGNSGAVCAPSRAMLLTGRPFYHLPESFTIPWSVKEGKGETDFLTFPEVFRSAGYQTFFTGKWHNSPPKLHKGFSDGEHIFMGGMHFLNKGGHKRPWVQAYDPKGEYPFYAQVQMDTFSSELYTNAALRFLRTYSPNLTADKKESKIQEPKTSPFLMMVSYTSPHDPRQAPQKYQDLYPIDSIQLPPNYMDEHPFNIGAKNERDENLLPMPRDSQAVKGEIAGYYAMISEVDAQIGRILDELENNGQLDNTIIVFAGDNGLGVGQHSLLGKQNLYDHSVRVPLILAGPGIPKGKQSDAMSMLIDVFPTIAHLAKVETPESIEGINLQPTFDTDEHLRDHIFLSFTNRGRGIRTKDNWKYIHYFVDGEVNEQLFNLNDDPWEINNLGNDDNYSAKKKTLKQLLLQDLITNKDSYLQPNLYVAYTDIQSPAIIHLKQVFPELQARYTIDNSKPNNESPVFEDALQFDKSVQINAQSFWNGQPVGELISTEVPKIEEVQNVTLSSNPAKRYAARGAYSLVDGLHGGEQFRDGKWLGFEEEDLEVVIELKDNTNKTGAYVSLLQIQNDWIFFPQRISFHISNDGKNFELIDEQHISINQKDPAIERKRISWNNVQQKAFKFLKVDIHSQGQCPPWHKGAGGKAWLFIDEIGIE